jgi:phosphonate transport system substrate-binding protein
MAVEASDPGQPVVLQFGVLNQQSLIQTAERWNPILTYLTQKTGIVLKLKMGASVEQTDAMMGRGEFDLIFTNHNFQKAHDGKYKVLARWGGEPIHGLIVVVDESPIRSLKDLHGQVVAFPSDEAFLAYAVPKVGFKEAGVAVVQKFAGHQEGALAQLNARQAVAAAVNSRFLQHYAEKEGLRYRILFQSEPFNETPVVVHPRVPNEQADAIKRALLGLATDPLAQSIRASFCPGFEPADEKDYDNVRRVYGVSGK